MRISDWSSDVCSSDLRVGKAPHRPGADRPHHEADGKDGRGAQKLRGRIGLGEKDRREIDGEGGIGEPVVPFDQIARRYADDRQKLFARYRLNLRSEERRVGKECVSTCIFRGSAKHEKKNSICET